MNRVPQTSLAAATPKVDVLQGPPFMQQRIALQLVPKEESGNDSNKMKWHGKIIRAAV